MLYNGNFFLAITDILGKVTSEFRIKLNGLLKGRYTLIVILPCGLEQAYIIVVIGHFGIDFAIQRVVCAYGFFIALNSLLKILLVLEGDANMIMRFGNFNDVISIQSLENVQGLGKILK